MKTVDLENIFQPVHCHLEAMEARFATLMAPPKTLPPGLLNLASTPTGKRMRPALLMLSGDACGQLNDRHVWAGTVVELIHTATLVHDDVIDDAALRRWQPTVTHAYGKGVSVLLGDYLFSLALRHFPMVGPQAVEILGPAIQHMCEGELRQALRANDPELTEAEYTQIISMKTAELYAASCELGALLAGDDEETVRRFTEYGRLLGIAFQIADDCLDLAGAEATAGKTLGLDLQKGKLTLPGIRLLKVVDSTQRERTIQLLSQPGDPAAREEVVALMQQYGTVQYALERAEEYAQQAIGQARALEALERTEPFELLAEFTVARTR